MNYTIISANDLQFNQFLDIVKDGTTYNVNFSNGEKFITKKCKTREEAQGYYVEIINYFIQGVYTFEQRAETLTNKNI